MATIVVNFVGGLWVMLTGPMRMFYNLGVILCSIAFATSFYIFHIILGGLTQLTGSKWLASKLTRENMVYLLIIGSSAAWFMSPTGSAHQAWGGFIGTRLAYPEESVMLFPTFVAPATEFCKPLITGGTAVPWDVWAPFIVFWWIYLYGVALLFTALATILRKDWIDVERVPFQQAMILYEFIRRMPKPEKPKIKISPSSPFTIGFILGVVFNLPILMTYLFPWFPDIYGWRTNTCGHGAIMSLADTPLWSIIGISMVNKHPLAVSVMYLAPLNIIFNIWFWYFVYLVLMQVAFYMGYYTGLNDPGICPTGCCRAWGPVNIRMDPPYKWNAFASGGMIAMTFFYLLIRWRYIRDTLRAAFGGYREFEKGEPVSYKVSWLLFLVGFIVIMAVWMAAGMDLVAALLLPVTFFFFWTTKTRIWGMTGTYIRAAEHGHTLYRLLLWPKAPEPIVNHPSFVLAAYNSEFNVDCPENQNAGSYFSAFAAYRLADLLKVDTRNVFKVLLVVQALAPLVSVTTWCWGMHLFGSTKLGWGAYVGSPPLDRNANPANWNRLPGREPWVHIFFIGFLAMGAISYLHSKFVWFPFEPIGFLMAFSEACLFFGVWLPALIAWILKYLTLRVGGSRLYEEHGIPVAAGFSIGFVSVSFIGGIIGIYRWFFPF
ncbi:hypothetical protein DRO57_01780 [Candidatus Bathyarchaeota archaeon]|nr:MAG: hypothetical protein DRO57_01780 [Candidatus Bathyarchaeota archaeon]